MEADFPELNKDTVKQYVSKTANAYPCVDKVLLYRDADPDTVRKYVLIYLIPDHARMDQVCEVRGDTLPAPRTQREAMALIELVGKVSCENQVSPDGVFSSYEASFIRKIILDECFGDKPYTILIAESMQAEELRRRIHMGSDFFTAYEKTQTDEPTKDIEEKGRMEVLRRIGKQGGSKSKKNLVLIAALRHILETTPELKDKPASFIERHIKRNYPFGSPLKIAGGKLYYDDDQIVTVFRKREGKIARTTFHRYMTEIKKEYKSKSSR